MRANLKSEEIIDLLLETRCANCSTSSPTSSAVHRKPNIRTANPAQRTVSTRQSNRTIERLSSVVIHDLIEQDEDRQGTSDTGARNGWKQAEPESVAPVQPHPPPRTRKAKETQTKLGVGRPVAAGGSGARAVTKSMNITNGKRGKSRSVKPQATIREGVISFSLPLYSFNHKSQNPNQQNSGLSMVMISSISVYVLY